MRGRGLIALLAMWFATLGVTAHAATWIDWQASRDGKTRSYSAQGFGLHLSSKADPAGGPSIPVLVIDVAGAPPLSLDGESGFDNPQALVGVVRLDPKAARPQVLLLTYTGGAHCCTTLKLAILTGGAWRTYALTYDGAPGRQVVYAKAGAPPALLIGDGAFDYTFASHAGSYLVERFYAVRGGRLYDVSGEARFARLRRQAMAETLEACGAKDTDRNGACAAYVAEASLVGQHAAAWRRMLKIYDRRSDWNLPDGCRIDTGPAGDCPADKTIKFKTYPAALAWFLWRNGYWPATPSFACVEQNCPVAWPKTPAP